MEAMKASYIGKRVLGSLGKGLLFRRSKKAGTKMDLVHCLEGRLYLKVIVNFHSLVAQSTRGRELFDHSSYYQINTTRHTSQFYCLQTCAPAIRTGTVMAVIDSLSSTME